MAHKIFTKREFPIILLYFSLYFVIGLSLLFRQPFGNPPDEYNRYLIPQYIAEHGTLPNGYDESIRIPAYGFSYAFQPILPYMIQGYTMRLVQHFTQNTDVLFYSARLVDFVFGLIMAVFVLLLSKKWFSDKRLQYLFCFLTMFLPQSIFVHTYVNTDSCCMMSIAIMLYGLTCCLQNDFAYPSCVVMSIGIILCALSYYNAYGFILSCILLFAAHYLSLQNGRVRLDWKPFLRKGLFIGALVLLGISWWFIRSYLLYDGDFLGLRTRDLCGALYGNEGMKPGARITYKSMGYTVKGMLFESDFLVLTLNSFICTYGPMVITTALWIYRFYKFLLCTGLVCCVLPLPLLGTKGSMPSARKSQSLSSRPALQIFFNLNMVFCILMPFILSIIYSYSTDYQPQGRYILPILIPLCMFCTRGMEKGFLLFRSVLLRAAKGKTVGEAIWERLFTGLCMAIILIIVAAIIVTVYGYAFPYYALL
jgi:hypothetical protein